MKIRKEFSALLLLLSLILALLPLTANRSFTAKPEKLLSEVLKEDVSFTVDQVAEFIVREDNTVPADRPQITGRIQETGNPRSCKYPLSRIH